MKSSCGLIQAYIVCAAPVDRRWRHRTVFERRDGGLESEKQRKSVTDQSHPGMAKSLTWEPKKAEKNLSVCVDTREQYET